MEQKQIAIERLQAKARELNRIPKKSDFEPEDVARIKSNLGPWPRALEQAGLKEAPAGMTALEKNREKRRRLVRLRRRANQKARREEEA